MTSRPLFIRLAELVVTIGPMSQVGCARASSGVTSCELFPRPAAERAAGGGQHEPVHLGGRCRSAGTGRWRSARSRPGRSGPSRAAALTRAPPTISDSLLASASVAPDLSAASVGARPIEPVMPLSTTSAVGFRDPGGGVRAGDDLRPVAGDAGRAGGVVDQAWRAAASPLATPTARGPVWTACRARSSRLPPPALRATTSKEVRGAVDDVDGLGADGPGGSEEDDCARLHDSSIPHRGGTPFHPGLKREVADHGSVSEEHCRDLSPRRLHGDRRGHAGFSS